MTENTTSSVTVWGTETPLDAISLAMLAASPEIHEIVFENGAGLETIDVGGVECEIEYGEEFHLGIELTDGLSVAISHIGETTPMVDLRYDGKNGDLVGRMQEKSKTARTLGELVDLPEVLAPFADLAAVLDDAEGPTWDGWYSMSWRLSGEALQRTAESSRKAA